MIEITCERNSCLLCKNITDDWLQVVQLRREVKKFKKGAYIFREGEPVVGIYFILHGKVKIDMNLGQRNIILRLAGNGKILGHRGFGIDDFYPVNAIALEETTVCFIPTDLFKSLLKTNVEFLYKLAFFYAEELKRTERRMKNMAHMPVKGRVVDALLQIKDAFGIDANGYLGMNMTKKDVAAMAGTVYETVIRVFNELALENYIRVENRKIKITDLQKLETCCGNFYKQL